MSAADYSNDMSLPAPPMIYKCAHDSMGSDAPCAFGCNVVARHAPSVSTPETPTLDPAMPLICLKCNSRQSRHERVPACAYCRAVGYLREAPPAAPPAEEGTPRDHFTAAEVLAVWGAQAEGRWTAEANAILGRAMEISTPTPEREA